MPEDKSLHLIKGFNDLLRCFLFALYQLEFVTEPFCYKIYFTVSLPFAANSLILA